MSTIEKKLFKEIEVKGSQPINPYEAGTKYYRGISTVNPENPNPVLYDLALIKQDIINIAKGNESILNIHYKKN